MPNEMSRVERKKQEARERILTAAETLFIDSRLYERVTIREIAGLADVSVGAVYLHFRTKEEILAELVGIQLKRLTKVVAEELAAAATGRGKLECFFSVLDKVRRDTSLGLYFRTNYLAFGGKIDEKILRVVQGHTESFYEFVVAIFRLGVEDGTLSVPEPFEQTALTFCQIVISFLPNFFFEESPLSFLNIDNFDDDAVFASFLSLLRSSVGIREK